VRRSAVILGTAVIACSGVLADGGIHAADLPSIRVLATGGTIAGAQASATDYGYKSGAYDVNSLLGAVPNLGKLAVIKGEQVANIGSQDMNDEVWLKLAKRVNAVLADPGTDGVLITHGTDTLEETSYFLSLVTKSDKPVVMVGSMRPATAISADGPGNIYNGVAVVTDGRAKAKGTLVVLNDTIHYARNVMKTDTTSVQTFQSLNRGPAGVVHTGKIEWFEPMDRKHGNATEFAVDGLPDRGRHQQRRQGPGDRRRRRRQHDHGSARRGHQGCQERCRRCAQHAPRQGHHAPQQRSQR
jgi:L-asparaginase